ncbi:MAG: hypothetical protein NC923_01575 [Candidatus Omnitrophica bacterium]|nr:hypothetical protein [Candidatus Omnitrophota bacterium]
MDQKIKFLLIGVCGVSLVFIFLFVQTLVSKQMLSRELDALKKENATLTAKIDKLDASIRDYENQLAITKKELETVLQQKDELDKNFARIKNERDELTKKLAEHSAQVVIPQPQAQPQTTDEYWANIIKEKSVLSMQLDELRNNFNALQLNNEQLQKDKNALQLEIANYKREKEDLMRQLDYNQKLMDSVARDLVRERSDKMKLQETYKKLKNENTTLIRQLNSLSGRKVTLDKKIHDLQIQKAELERRLNEMETMLIDRVGNVSELKEAVENIRKEKSKADTVQAGGKEAVELPPIVVHPVATPSSSSVSSVSTAAFEGKIVAINKENNFVIIDLGERAGLKAGDTLQAYREDKIIANLEVIQTRNDISACDIIDETTPLQIGDIVK